ncbi:hypothetical protein HP548_03015 [Paenibacillus taichungensis]|uniref:Uncharacterized protein n=1 Tax=Paenibacillus taichungensis TaxID=484184 RepID=A0ABX2MII4_9BACL|nr:hypothetical protein [Paenibacillus taichungensis]NUU53068.1 hypothetical protein [Paenibacillus taichungensis]
MFDKPSARITNPPQRSSLRDEGTVIGLSPWFSVLSVSMARTVKDAVKCGMPEILAEQLYENALKTAVPMATRVGKQPDGYNPGIVMTDQSMLSHPDDAD